MRLLQLSRSLLLSLLLFSYSRIVSCDTRIIASSRNLDRYDYATPPLRPRTMASQTISTMMEATSPQVQPVSLPHVVSTLADSKSCAQLEVVCDFSTRHPSMPCMMMTTTQLCSVVVYGVQSIFRVSFWFRRGQCGHKLDPNGLTSSFSLQLYSTQQGWKFK